MGASNPEGLTVKHEALCSICDCWKAIHSDDRCMACYQYRRRHGHDRPIAAIVQHGQRVLQRMQEEQAS